MAALFLGSFFANQEFPNRKETRIAFLGRSNVGKSALINLLAGTKIARVSKTPGRTRALNLYEIDQKWIFGDFPGYGYARVSKKEQKVWEVLVKKFLRPRYFHCAVQIVDARHPGMESDRQLHQWLKFSGLPHVIVMNKADQLNQKERVEADRQAHTAFAGQPLLFASTFTKEGKRELEKNLQQLTTSSAATRNASL